MTYRLIGADQREYGPFTVEEMHQWIAEGRANGQTLVQPEGGADWKALSSFPELAGALASSPLPPLPPPQVAAPSPGAAHPQNHGLAVAGLVCSLVGLVCCGPLFSTLGLIFCAVALSQINRDPTKWQGAGLARAGIVWALIGYCLTIIFFTTGIWRGFLRHFTH